MDKWEYKTETRYLMSQQELDSWLNDEGAEGWEAVSITDVRDNKEITFKRKVE